MRDSESVCAWEREGQRDKEQIREKEGEIDTDRETLRERERLIDWGRRRRESERLTDSECVFVCKRDSNSDKLWERE